MCVRALCGLLWENKKEWPWGIKNDRSTMPITMCIWKVFNKYSLNKWMNSTCSHVLWDWIKIKRERNCKTEAYPRGDDIQGYNNTNNNSTIITDTVSNNS